jgi:ribosomal protein S18 acetylase RimI-like enzyme
MDGSMTGPRASLFCSIELAARIERAVARFMADSAESVGQRRPTVILPVAGGVATWTGPGAPFNKVSGMGFASPPAEAELEAVERAFSERGEPVQVELSNLAEAGLAARLSRRGYQLSSFENVLGLRLPATSLADGTGAIAVVQSDGADVTAWIDVLVEGFAHPDDQGVTTSEEYPRSVLEPLVIDMTRVRGMALYTARIDGEIAGGASLHVSDGVAQLTGAATRPRHRRRGVQTALLTTRLQRAAAAGCDIAVVTTQPGSKSQENVQRLGFELLYTRAILMRPR